MWLFEHYHLHSIRWVAKFPFIVQCASQTNVEKCSPSVIMRVWTLVYSIVFLSVVQNDLMYIRHRWLLNSALTICCRQVTTTLPEKEVWGTRHLVSVGLLFLNYIILCPLLCFVAWDRGSHFLPDQFTWNLGLHWTCSPLMTFWPSFLTLFLPHSLPAHILVSYLTSYELQMAYSYNLVWCTNILEAVQSPIWGRGVSVS